MWSLLLGYGLAFNNSMCFIIWIKLLLLLYLFVMTVNTSPFSNLPCRRIGGLPYFSPHFKCINWGMMFSATWLVSKDSLVSAMYFPRRGGGQYTYCRSLGSPVGRAHLSMCLHILEGFHQPQSLLHTSANRKIVHTHVSHYSIRIDEEKAPARQKQNLWMSLQFLPITY